MMISLAGCAREPRALFDFGHKYRLVPTSAYRQECGNRQDLEVSPASCEYGSASVRDEQLVLCIHPDSSEILLAITNRASTELYVDLAKSTYRDERRVLHALAQNSGRVAVVPGERAIVPFVPEEKVYLVQTGFLHQEETSEPLIPFSLKNLSLAQTESKIDAIARDRREVEINATIQGPALPCDRLYSVRLVLKPRYSTEQWDEIRHTAYPPNR